MGVGVPTDIFHVAVGRTPNILYVKAQIGNKDIALEIRNRRIVGRLIVDNIKGKEDVGETFKKVLRVQKVEVEAKKAH